MNMKETLIQEKLFNEDLTLKTPLDEDTDELIITGRFPPVMDTSGLVLSKRIMLAGKKVDVICGDYDLKKDETFYKLIKNFINEKFIVSSNSDTIYGIQTFRKEGMELLHAFDKEYDKIYSRSWTLGSHFLALDYKIEHPDVKWTAEFSDPMRVDINNKLRKDSEIVFNDDEYLEKINKQISDLNQQNSYDFPLITKYDSRYFLTEYLPFLFADEIVFTNKNQRQIMLKRFPFDMKSYVIRKSKISRHPTLDEEFYHIMESDYHVDEDYVNFGYFGTFYGKRHWEHVILAFEMLEEDIKEKIKIHIFSNEDLLIKDLISNTSLEEHIIINQTVDFLEFLNLCTLMDVLIVNDTITENFFDKNPYLPSKYADYLGSKTKIWALCEKSSIMNTFEIDYKSDITLFSSSATTLKEILKDFGLESNAEFDDLELIRHYQNRLTTLNDVFYSKFLQKEFWNKRYNDLNSETLTLKREHDQLTKQFDEKSSKLDYVGGEFDGIHLQNTQLKEYNYELQKALAESNSNFDNLKKEHLKLHNITKNSFKHNEESNDMIDLYKEEIIGYKQDESLFNRLISNPLSRMYIRYKIPRKEREVTRKLFEKVKYSSWFNRYYYIHQNNDVDKFCWYKLLSPELHYVCHGIDEDRHANAYEKRKLSKKALLKILEHKK